MAKKIRKSVKPKDSAKRPVKAGAEAAAVGSSNTLPSNDLSYTYSVCIDYIKFRFNGEFDLDSILFKHLLEILKVKPFMFEKENGNNGYAVKYVFDENVIFQVGGRSTKNAEGQETWLMEMSGSSCRDFEERHGDWKALLSHCITHRAVCTRIDVAIDDFTGNITPNEIKYRIHQKLYAMPMRSWKMVGGVEVLDEGVENEKALDIWLSKDDGFTADFGTKYSKQLSIYNKKAERMSKEYAVFVKNWMRYEGRFFKESAVSAVNIVLSAIQEDRLPVVTAGLIRGLVEFKEVNNYAYRDRAKAPIWNKWEQMLQGAEKITFVNQAKLETSLARKHEWLLTYAGPTLLKAMLANPGEFDKIMAFIFVSALEKLDKTGISSINKLRRQSGKDDITLEWAKEFVLDNYSKDVDNQYIADVLYRFI